MADEKKKRLLSILIDNDVRKVTITGENSDNQVVMREELSDEELDIVTGGKVGDCTENYVCTKDQECPQYYKFCKVYCSYVLV